ncbi:hypothetical protein D9M72_510400 [compost metagenome]
MRQPPFQAVRVLGTQLPAGAGGHPDDQRHVELPAGHVQQRGGIVHQLVQRQQAEIDGHDLHNGTHPAQCRPDACAHEAGFGQWGVPDPFRTEFLEQAKAHGETPAVRTNILTHEEYPFIALDGIPDGCAHGLAVGGLHSGLRSL